MDFPYSPELEAMMRYHFCQGSEKQRRQYAAVEAAKLGHGGLNYIAQLFDISPNTIRAGQEELKKKPVATPRASVMRVADARKRRRRKKF